MKRIVLLFAAASLTAATLYALDRNGNGLSDVWETLYNVTPAADPASDWDGDGQALFMEAAFGTDPRDPASATRATMRSGPAANTLLLSLGTQPGKRYRLESSSDLITWVPLGDEFTGDGTEMDALGLLLDSLAPDRQFFRPKYAGEFDADGDGITLWEETRLGLSDTIADFDGDGLKDGFEIGGGLDPRDDGSGNPNNGAQGDPDGDGFSNREEAFNQLDPQKAEELLPNAHLRYISIDVPLSDPSTWLGVTNQGEVVAGSGALFRPGQPPSDLGARVAALSHSGLAAVTGMNGQEAKVRRLNDGTSRPLKKWSDAEILAQIPEEDVPENTTPEVTSQHLYPSAISESGLVAGEIDAWVGFKSHLGYIVGRFQISRMVGWDLEGNLHKLGAGENPHLGWETYRPTGISDQTVITGYTSDYSTLADSVTPLKWIGWETAPALTAQQFDRNWDINGRGEEIFQPLNGEAFFEDSLSLREGWSYMLNDAKRVPAPDQPAVPSAQIIGYAEGLGNAFWQKSLTEERYLALEVQPRVAPLTISGGASATWEISGLLDINDQGILLSSGQVVEADGTYGEYTGRLLLPFDLKWEAVGGNGNIDDNPDPFQNGKKVGNRVFPGADQPGGSARDTVNLKITGGLPNAVVHLKAFDVDDPTPASFDNERKIDPNDLANNPPAGVLPGQDNRGGAGIFVASGSATHQVTLDASGEAILAFKVGMKAGDNYRVCAQLLQSDQISTLQETDSTATGYVSADDEPVNGLSSGAASPLLTVWRKLHVENDSMSEPQTKPSPDRQMATGTGWDVSGSRTVLIVDLPESVPSSFYEAGTVTRNGITYRIRPLTAHGAGNTGVHLILNSLLTQPEKDAFGLGATEITDDDDIAYPGGYHAVLPRNDLLTDEVKKTFRPAYIEVEAAPSNYSNSNVPFYLNIEFTFFGNFPSDVRDKATLPDSTEYWGTRLTAAYQDEVEHDQDPLGDTGSYGATSPSYRLSLIYLESMIDFLTLPGHTPPALDFDRFSLMLSKVVSHEIGHIPGDGDESSDHAEGGLMDPSNTETDVPESFVPATIERFRDTESWKAD